jgi:hypothetical protein
MTRPVTTKVNFPHVVPITGIIPNIRMYLIDMCGKDVYMYIPLLGPIVVY